MKSPRTNHQMLLTVLLLLGSLVGLAALAAPTVPTEAQMPGTQPNEIPPYTSPNFGSQNCKSCHGNTTNPELEPYHGWQGSMMSHSSRDPLFWAQLAVVEQDFLPNADPNLRGGAGDFCLRCHMPNGWLQGHSTPTDGSGMIEATDDNGVECHHCHLLVDPDPAVNVTGTVEKQNAPFIANDGTKAYRGSGMYVLNDNVDRSRLGPYDNPSTPHTFLQSSLHRSSEMCATCHDVSNPIVGDLAHNNGAQQPLSPGDFSGVVGAPITNKAAFNNHPQSYGVVERTYSEWKASEFSTFLVDDFSLLPDDLKTTGGALQVAHEKAWNTTTMTANYSNPTQDRLFSCQTCHMSASTGVGCRQGGTPTRTDLPRHDLTGASYWVPAAIQYQDTEGTLRFGGGLDAAQLSAMNDGMVRAKETLQSSARLDATVYGGELVVKTTNLTGHKLITGYPEGRRMWLNVRWYDGGDALVHEDGGYGPIGRTVEDSNAVTHQVESLLDLDNTVVFDAGPGMDKEWADQLLAMGVDSSMPLAYDRMTDAVTETVGTLAAKPSGSATHTFHFALNNTVMNDNRIPPYNMDRDLAMETNALPVPATQYGNPEAGESYDYWNVSSFGVPAGAVRAEVRLYFQQTSWEYIQFLFLQNDQQNAFLGQEGVNMLDAWLNTTLTDDPAPDDFLLGTTQAPPLQMSFLDVPSLSVGSAPGEAELSASLNGISGDVDLTFTPACDATEHTIYYGPLSQVSSYGYTGAKCSVGSSGSASFDPGSGSFFFFVVGNNGLAEGSYGQSSAAVERTEDVGTLGCDLIQDLTDTCQ